MAAIANHTEAVHDLACLGADCLLGAEEGERVHVALKGDLVLNDATCTGHVDRPVEADRIAAGGRDFGEPFAAALREVVIISISRKCPSLGILYRIPTGILNHFLFHPIPPFFK